MSGENLNSPFPKQTTLVSQRSIRGLTSIGSAVQPDNPTPIERACPRMKSSSRRFSRSKVYPHIHPDNRKTRLYDKPSRRRSCSQCSSSKKQGSSHHHIENTLERLTEMVVRQEQLLITLQRMYDDNRGAPGFPHSYASQSSFQLNPVVFNSSSLQNYVQNTLHPNPIQLCDMFLARYNLPHILSGSYDPIELIHAHGWEQGGCGDVSLVVQETAGGNPKEIEVPWKHVDQMGEPRLALKLTQVAALIKEHWLYQGRSIRNSDEVGVPFETDEFADTIIFLNCPGFTKALLYQSGYDSCGAHFAREPWLSGKRSLLCQLQPDDDRLRIDRSCPWDGKVFGRIWQVFHARRLLSFACIYLALSQMSVVGDTSQRIMETKKALRFVSYHVSKWPRFKQTSEVWLSSNWIHLHFHFRVLSAEKQPPPSASKSWPKNGLRPSRVSGVLTSLSGVDNIRVIEERFSIALVASHTTEMPSYTILYLSDSEYRRLFMESERTLDMPSRGKFTGVAVYLRVLLSILPIWKRKWVETLNEIDNLVGVKTDDLFDPQRDGATMMFDSTFERSRLYFTALQALRIFSEWIQESGRELQQLKQDFDFNTNAATARRGSIGSDHGDAPSYPFAKEIDGQWEQLISIHSSASKALLDRIEKKEAEVKSFRDGLFSATSVREASRATVLNQYILVFTIVTIFYLPLNYVSSLFSMDVFTYDDIRLGQSSFFISTVTIAFLTWAVSAIVLWLVHDDERLARFGRVIRDFQWKFIRPRRRREFNDEKLDSVFQGV